MVREEFPERPAAADVDQHVRLGVAEGDVVAEAIFITGDKTNLHAQKVA